MKGHKVLWVVCLAVAMAFAVAACGDDESSSGGGESTGQTKGAKAIDVASMDSAKGDVTYCTGKDTSGDLNEGIKEFNEANPDLNAKLLEFPESADEQRNQFIQRQRAKSADCDAFESDVVWTAEFASQKWLLDMTPYIEKRKAEFVPSTLVLGRLRGQDLGRPARLRRRPPLLPQGQGRGGPRDLAGGLRARRRTARASSTRARPTRA